MFLFLIIIFFLSYKRTKALGIDQEMNIFVDKDNGVYFFGDG
jgi:hypothetical protein